MPGSNVKLGCEPISDLAQLLWHVGGRALVRSDQHHFHRDSLMILNASVGDAGHYSCWSVERSHGHEHRRLGAEYRLTLGTRTRGGLELPTSPQAQSSNGGMVGMQVLVALLSVTLVALVAWNYYKGHLTLLPCKLGGRQEHPEGSQGDVASTLQPLQSTEEKPPGPAGNSNNNHGNQEHALSMDGHAAEESSI